MEATGWPGRTLVLAAVTAVVTAGVLVGVASEDAAGETAVGVDPERVTVQPGHTATASIVVAAAAGVGAHDLRVTVAESSRARIGPGDDAEPVVVGSQPASAPDGDGRSEDVNGDPSRPAVEGAAAVPLVSCAD
jgi:hypothetical protein